MTNVAHIVVVGASFKRVPIEVLENLSLKATSASIGSILSVRDGEAFALLSTCNRVEIYVVTEDPVNTRKKLVGYLTGLDRRAGDHIYALSDTEVIRHLLKVACGFDSMVPGEPQILLQVKKASIFADPGFHGKILEKLFQHAYAAGEKIRRAAGIQANSSIGDLALRFIHSRLGGKARILLVGAGKNARAVIGAVNKYRLSDVRVANRAPQKIRASFIPDSKIHRLDEIPSLLRRVDAVIVATSSSSYVISGDLVRSVVLRRKIILMDISLPRNIDPSVSKNPFVELYNISDLRDHAGVEFSKSQIEKVDRLVDGETTRFLSWLATLEVDPIIKLIRIKAERIRRQELAEALRRLKTGKEEEEKVISVLSTRIVNRLLHEPSIRLREVSGNGEAALYGKALKELFGVSD